GAPEFPDVPTLAEAGVPGQESLFFQGVVAPAGTPKEIVGQLYREIAKILVRPEVKERLAAIGFGVSISSPEEFQAQIKSEMARWAKVIHDANIKRMEWSGGAGMKGGKDSSGLYEVERRAYHAARPGFRIAELQISPTQKVPWHYHTNVHDTFYVVTGAIRIFLQRPKEEVRLTQGE